MWDFLLVLGRVPGTNLVITFSEIIGFSCFLPFIWLAHKRLLHADLRRTLRLLQLHLQTKKGQQLKLPV
ncbi:MAG TPA: hypothetical protein VFW52_00350 [Candidatus Saccharimonadales bacterium]|nr:hypothetical protein [Candidatus Saccharimonadales bacterium]